MRSRIALSFEGSDKTRGVLDVMPRGGMISICEN
jgi:hypothetical protein